MSLKSDDSLQIKMNQECQVLLLPGVPRFVLLTPPGAEQPLLGAARDRGLADAPEPPLRQNCHTVGKKDSRLHAAAASIKVSSI